jgi:F0F1-type ATP synthase alpha subunit
MSSVVVVLSGADEASTLQFLAPYTGATTAEYFMYQGTATCSVYDEANNPMTSLSQLERKIPSILVASKLHPFAAHRRAFLLR